MKHKSLYLTIFSFTGLIITSLAVGLFNANVTINNADEIEYTLSLDNDNKFTSSSTYTSGEANPISDQNKTAIKFAYSNLKNNEDGFATFKNKGSIHNIEPINGLKSISFDLNDSFTLSYGFEEINSESYFASTTLTGTGSYTFTNNLPSYISITNTSGNEVDVTSIVFHYSCLAKVDEYEVRYHTNGGSISEVPPSTKTSLTINYLNTGYDSKYASEVFIYAAGTSVNQLYAHKIGIIKHNIDGEYIVNQIKASGETAYNNLDSDYWIVVHGSNDAGYLPLVSNDTKVVLGDIIRLDKDLSSSTSTSANISLDVCDGSEEYYSKSYTSVVSLPTCVKEDETFNGWYVTNAKSGNKVNLVGNSIDVYAMYGEDEENKGLAISYLYTSVSSTSDNVIENSDILNVAFGSVSATGTISNASTIGSTAQSVKNRAETYGNKVLLSINGATNLSTVAASDSLRTALADNLVSLINTYNLDGVDVDWEYPSSSEKANFTLLMNEIYTKVKADDENNLVTAAMGIDTYTRYDLANSINYIDYINVMTYDMHAGSKYAQHHSALYKNNAYTCIDTAMKYYITTSSVPASKLVLGIPYYGYLHTGVTSIGSSCDSGSAISYANIVNNYLSDDSYEQLFDDTAKVPYLYNSTSGEMIAYDNPESIALKGEYAKAKGLAGMFSWQDGQDKDDILANAMFDALKDWKQESPVDPYNYRETAVTYMNNLATVTWTPTTTFTYYDNNSTRTFNAGTTYTGLPYTQGNGRTKILSDPLNLFKAQIDSDGNYVGPTGYNDYYGSDCSSSVYGAWNAAGSGISSATYTLMMLPSQNSEIKAVGDYSYSSESTSTAILSNSTQAEMYECYKQVLPGDAFVKRGDSSGHVRMVTSIDIDNQLVYFTEQYGWGAGTNTTWKKGVSYSFATLYSGAYIPISNTHLLLDTVYSN